VDAYKRVAKERNEMKAKLEERDQEDEAILNADVGLAPPPPDNDDEQSADAASNAKGDTNDVENELLKQLGGQPSEEGNDNGNGDLHKKHDDGEPHGNATDSAGNSGTVYQIDEEEREREARRKELERQREAAYQARLRELVRETHVLRRQAREARERCAESERAYTERVEELEHRLQEQKDFNATLQTKSGEQIERLATELQRELPNENVGL
jgi:hypothetical protein